jgi:DNA-binding Lrp family transcriptional regulator
MAIRPLNRAFEDMAAKGRPRTKPLDEIDARIVAHLQREARIPLTTLADRVGLSPAPCLRRVRSLEKRRVIRKYVALVDPAALGLTVTALVHVSLDHQVQGGLEAFEQVMKKRPEVLECWITTGPFDVLLRVVVQDVETYESFLRQVLSRIPGVASINTSFALKQVKFQTQLPIADIDAASGPVLTRP